MADYYMIGAKVDGYYRVLEVATNEAASLEAMACYADMYCNVARRVASESEYVAYSEGSDDLVQDLRCC